MAKLSMLLDQIDTGTVLLPEFQRGYVWNRDQGRGLMRSIYRGHPVGSLLMWKTSDPDQSAHGGSASHGPYLMLLDGQQRITSLYGVITGNPPGFFDGDAKLSKGDLALAKVCAQWPQARRMMRDAIDRWQGDGYRFSLDWLLRVINALAMGRAQFDRLGKVGAEEFQAALEKSIEHTDTFLEAVQGRLGLDHDRVLKSRSSIAVVVRLLEANGGAFDDRAHQDKVLYWYMQSALWARYTGTTESNLQRDYETAVKSGVDGLINSLKRARSGSLRVKPHDFEGTQGGRFYPLLYLPVRVSNARDLVTGRALTAEALGEEPQLRRIPLFSTQLLRGTDGKADSIANFCFLNSEEDLRAYGSEPWEFLVRAEAEHPGVLASQWIPTDPELWRPERYQDFLAARRTLLAEAANVFLEELLDGTAADEATELTPLTVAPEAPVDPRAARIRELVDALREAGYAEPELDTVISDPVRGEVIAEAEAFWPEGLQRGLGKPVVLELDPEQADLPRLQELGYEVFTSVDSLWGYVERSGRESSGESSAQIPVATSWLDEGWSEEDSVPETTDFGKEILGLYERSKNEAGYTPSALLSMVSDLGPLGTARKLLAAPAVSDGFANLWDKGRLDLTVEALVLQPRFAPLFTEEELGRARTRLEQFGHPFLDD